VILMGTSTGGTLALQLAATYPKDPISALILMSPNIAINNPAAWMLNNPWGLQIARLVEGGKYYPSNDSTPAQRQYWNAPYRLEALTQLEERKWRPRHSRGCFSQPFCYIITRIKITRTQP
jgi:alpha-beta hydrolase superfamily lysophospholipase